VLSDTVNDQPSSVLFCRFAHLVKVEHTKENKQEMISGRGASLAAGDSDSADVTYCGRSLQSGGRLGCRQLIA